MGDGCRHSIKANTSLAHHVLKLCVCLACHLLEFLQWVETCVDELHQVLALHLSCRCHLSKDKGQTAKLLLVAHGDVAKLLQVRNHLLCAHTESKHHLGIVLQVQRLEWGLCRKVVDVTQHLCRCRLVANKRLECHACLLGLRPDG